MKAYPSISKNPNFDIYLYGFDKLDGSNIRAEWSKKKGFHKFGTRTRLLDPNELPFGKAVELVKNKYDSLQQIFADQKYQDTTCFFEFHGPNSFAGNHADEEQTVTLIDVNPYKKGITPPSELLKIYDKVELPKLLHQGKINKLIIEQINEGTFPGMTFEGIVFKGIHRNQVVMFKVKSKLWLTKLKDHCKDNEALFNQLS